MAQKETAEQKLLKIIEASKKAQAVASGSAPAQPVPKKSSRLISFTIQQINIFLVVCMVASALFLGYQVQSGMALLQETVSFSVDSDSSKNALDLFIPQTKSIAYYLDKINSRNIFQPFEKKAIGADAPSGQAALEKKMSKFKIVGIAWLDVPESATVMLEDTTAHMTHFLKEGDKVEDVFVKTIYTDRVVFGRANEEITIKL
jgi:hypothetical protein